MNREQLAKDIVQITAYSGVTKYNRIHINNLKVILSQLNDYRALSYADIEREVRACHNTVQYRYTILINRNTVHLL